MEQQHIQCPADTAQAAELQYFPVVYPHGWEHFDTPIPTPEMPAVLSYIIHVRRRRNEVEGVEGGKATENAIYFYIGRDASQRLSAFTIAYRFSPLPVMMPDSDHPYTFFTYAYADINDGNTYLVCRLVLPKELEDAGGVSGCSAYVSGVTYEDGTICNFLPELFTYRDHDMEALVRLVAETGAGTASAEEGIAETVSREEEEKAVFEALEAAQNGNGRNAPHRKRFLWIYTVIFVCLAVGVGMLSVRGIQYLSYQKTMLCADVYIHAGAYRQAEAYVQNALGSHNPFYRAHLRALTETTRLLCAEGRYLEAYEAAAAAPYATLLQAICREASAHAIGEGDYEAACVYASSAPDPFLRELTTDTEP
ncbi:MAG: hypothetical protein J6I50_05210 [Clostridia bacterium]|nr:hypothetical protein [Clostridia bacterium]